MKDKGRYVTYEEFGAKGDGVTDDIEAIIRCHDYANEHGLDVVGRDNAIYYIGGRALTAKIRTNVRWGKACFIIDDRNLENINTPCFAVIPDTARYVPELPLLHRGQKKVEFPHEGSVYVQVFDNSKKLYIRKGLNQNNGSPKSDAFVVDGDGNITGDINWDYEHYSEIFAISTDDAPITLEGGIFTTIANEAESFYRYHARNINVTRSHTTVRDLTHFVSGEGDHGAPYNAFLSLCEAYDLTVQDCLLTPHKTYWTQSKIPGQMVPMGSYDLSFHAAVGVKLYGLRQTIDIRDTRYWGLMGSNFSKEFYMENCIVSRFDAHMGITNGAIRHCTLGHMGINLIGFGEFLVEDTKICGAHAINFRSDYGSFFHGKLTLRNCVWMPKDNVRDGVAILHANNTGDHDFGYDCGMPETIEIDGLLVEDSHLPPEITHYAVFGNYDSTFAEGKPYPYGTPKNVRLSGITSASGREIMVCKNAAAYPHLTGLVIG